MALLVAGFWPTTFFPDSYWHEDFWQNYGLLLYVKPRQKFTVLSRTKKFTVLKI